MHFRMYKEFIVLLISFIAIKSDSLDECPKFDPTYGCQNNTVSRCIFQRGFSPNESCSRCCANHYFYESECHPCGECGDGNGEIEECALDGNSRKCGDDELHGGPVSPERCVNNTTQPPITRTFLPTPVQEENCRNATPPCSGSRCKYPRGKTEVKCSECPVGEYYYDGECNKCGPCEDGYSKVPMCALDGDVKQCPDTGTTDTDHHAHHLGTGVIVIVVLTVVVVLVGVIVTAVLMRRKHKFTGDMQIDKESVFEEQLGDKDGMTDLRYYAQEEESTNPNIDMMAPGLDSEDDDYDQSEAFKKQEPKKGKSHRNGFFSRSGR